MLIEFRFKNYRSFRDEAVLSMEATGLSSFKKSLIPWSSTTKLLPAIAIYGKNGGGKSNVIRAFGWPYNLSAMPNGRSMKAPRFL